MSQPFPRLGDLFLLFTTTEALSPVLPDTLRVPFLRSLALHGIGLPKGLSSSIPCFMARARRVAPRFRRDMRRANKVCYMQAVAPVRDQRTANLPSH